MEPDHPPLIRARGQTSEFRQLRQWPPFMRRHVADHPGTKLANLCTLGKLLTSRRRVSRERCRPGDGTAILVNRGNRRRSVVETDLSLDMNNLRPGRDHVRSSTWSPGSSCRARSHAVSFRYKTDRYVAR
jgi:hypothetical protein